MQNFFVGCDIISYNKKYVIRYIFGLQTSFLTYSTQNPYNFLSD